MKKPYQLVWKSPQPLMKGSSAQEELASEQAAFYKTLTADYATQFAQQSAILSSLNTAFQPIIEGGIGQYGFTPQEDTSIRTSASDSIAQNFASAQTALNENIASRGGGNTFLPSGATSQLEAGLLSSEASQQASTSNQITQAGYQQGRQNFLSAAGILGGVASQYNPTGYAGVGNTAGQDAFSSATTLYNQGNAWEGIVGGIVGGAAGAFLGNPSLGGILGGSGGGGIGNTGGNSGE
jgi:hypothetical protein